MKRLWIRKAGMLFLAAVMAVIAAALPVAAVPNDPANGENEMEVLAYGPVHEAFAETVAFDPKPGIIVPKAPPESINEIPPDQKPDGDVDWIPGYWGWDDDRNDFLWISGTWRAVPPGRRWVPGYWIGTAKGYQWITGYWASQSDSTTTYLPQPPESAEVGPNVNAPSPNHTWIPGCWIWYRNAYAWRPGYWAPVRTDRVWIPPHYVWTPMGYVFVGGYWDFAVASRGLIFAPVAFGVSFTFGSGFYFTPSFAINLGVFSNCLFLRPRYHHYYFGDYYATRHYQRGIYPWFSPHARRHGYDPIYAHQRWKNRSDRHWERDLQATYRLRLKNQAARPPRTLREARRLQQNSITAKAAGRGFQQPFNPLIKSRGNLPKLKTLSNSERVQFERHGKQVQNFSRQRLNLESRGLKQPFRGPSGVIKATLSKSHIGSKPVGRASVTGSSERSKSSLFTKAVPSKRKTVQEPQTPTAKGPKSRTAPYFVLRAPERRFRPTGVPTARKTPPARYQTSKTHLTVQPVQQKPIKTWGRTSSSLSPNRKSTPDIPRLSKSSRALSKPAGPVSSKKLSEVRQQEGVPAGRPSKPGR